MIVKNEIIPLDPSNQEHIKAASELHALLLPESPIPQLGEVFMRKFYYPLLIKDDLMKCDLYKYEGEYIAFSVYTKQPFTFMSTAQKRHFFKLAIILFLSILRKPSRIGVILKASSVNSSRKNQDECDNTGEVLSFGVLEKYKSLKDTATGLRISNLLFENSLKYFKNEGFSFVRGEIQKKNLLSLLFWQSYKAVLSEKTPKERPFFTVNIDLSKV